MTAKYEAWTVVSTTPEYTLGEVREDYDSTYGRRKYVYVQNGHAATAFALGMPVVTEGGAQNYFVGAPCAADAKRPSVLGAALGAVPAQSYCWLLKEGRGSLLGDGSVAAGSLIYTGTATFSQTAGTGESLGVAEADDAGSPILFNGYINCG